MTDEEIRSFALQLSEAERIRVLMEQDAAMDGGHSATEPPVEEPGPDLYGEMPLLERAS